jgi:hypothetical protein
LYYERNISGHLNRLEELTHMCTLIRSHKTTIIKGTIFQHRKNKLQH